MFKSKQKHSLLLLMCVAVVVLGFVALASAYKRPYNATMDYVPQNVGVYDTYYCNFKESDCRACHGTTTAWRHHGTEWAVSGQCATTCHLQPYNPYTNPERDCKECHVDGTWVPVNGGNLGFPHHRSGLAAAGICTGCHSSILISDANDVEPPQFDPTTVTPTPYSCENCHWPSGNAAHQPPPLADWNLWTGYPRPTTWPDSLPHPAPIEANGPATTGSIVAGDPIPTAGKPYRPLDGTHHDIDGAVGPNCKLCHATSPSGDLIQDPSNPYLIRTCENCHDIYTLHDGITEHTTNGIGGFGFGGYTVGGVLNRVVVMNQKCVACHGDVIARPMPVDPGVPPVINTVEPPMGSAGITVSLLAGVPDFGSQGDFDGVYMQQGISGWIQVPVVSWNTDKIEFEVPGATFAESGSAGLAKISVAKKYWVETLLDGIGDDDSTCDPGEVCTQITRASSPASNFYIRQHPILGSLVPGSGTWGTVVTINADALAPASFFTAREDCTTPGLAPYGYSTYVELVASNDKYRVTEMSGSGWAGDAALNPWSASSIKVRIRNLRDVNTGVVPLPLADLYKGNWQLYVVTDYFKDDGDGVYMLKHASGHLLGSIDSGDTLLYREISDPLPWFATDTPFISSTPTTSVKAANLGAVYGINFGTTQDTSVIKVRPCGAPTPTANLAVVQWSNTRVVFRAPNSPPIPPGGANACVQVVVPKVLPPGNTDSNLSAPIWFYP